MWDSVEETVAKKERFLTKVDNFRLVTNDSLERKTFHVSRRKEESLNLCIVSTAISPKTKDEVYSPRRFNSIIRLLVIGDQRDFIGGVQDDVGD